MTWTLGRNGDKCAKNHAICDGPHVLAKVYGGGYPAGEGWSARTEAIARKMAAADDLFRALRTLVRLHPDMHEHVEGGAICAWCAAEKALAKASP